MKDMVGIAQLVSAPDCGSGGREFESLYPPQQKKEGPGDKEQALLARCFLFYLYWAVAKW